MLLLAPAAQLTDCADCKWRLYMQGVVRRPGDVHFKLCNSDADTEFTLSSYVIKWSLGRRFYYGFILFIANKGFSLECQPDLVWIQ